MNKPKTKVCTKCHKQKTLKAWNANSTCGVCYNKAIPREVRRRYERAWELKNPDKLREKWRRAYDNNKEIKKARMLNYRKRNLEKLRAYDRERWKDPNRKQAQKDYIEANRERVRAVDRAEYRRNKYKHIARVNGRRSYTVKATPKWADLNKIAEFYRNCPKGHHVDHIIPLRGKNVCGLHVLENLQYLPSVENLKKSNKWQL